MFWLNLKHAIRRLRSNAVTSVVVIVTLTVALGVNATIFALLKSFFWSAPPVKEPESLVRVSTLLRGEIHEGLSSRYDYRYCRDNNKSFSGLSAHYSAAALFLSSDAGSAELLGSCVSSNFFSMLGVRPALGSLLLPDDETAGGNVAVLSYGLWDRLFARDPGVIGKEVKLNRISFTVSGVAPDGFHGVTSAGSHNDIWIPLSMAAVAFPWCDTLKKECAFLDMVGRLTPGMSIEQASAEMGILAKAIEETSDRTQPVAFTVLPLKGGSPSLKLRATPTLRLVFIAALVLLLIACVNVSGLFLAQSVARKEEMAIRFALGSNRLKLFLQLWTEVGILNCLGGLGGLLLANWLLPPLSTFPIVRTNSYVADLRIDSSLVLYMAGLVTLTAFAAAMVPALRTANSDLYPTLKGEERTGGNKSAKVHSALIIAQVTLSLVLLLAAGLLIKSMRYIYDGPGYDASHLAFARVTPARLGYEPEKCESVQKEVIDRLRALPGVESVSISGVMPWWESGTRWVATPDNLPTREEDKFLVQFQVVGSGFLSTLRVPVIQGRDFNEDDNKNGPDVVIINETLAKRMFIEGDAVGKALAIMGETHSVVGVARDAQYRIEANRPVPSFYLPYWKINDGTDAYYWVRTAGDPSAVLSAIRQEIRQIDPDVPVSRVETMDEGLNKYFVSVRFATVVLLFTSGIACFLSMIGLYSLVHYSVLRRTREIGLRVALGATRLRILKLMMRRGLCLMLIGLAAGVIAALMSVRLLSSLLYGVRATDITVLLCVIGVLMLVSLLANFIPALRAARLDPMKSIREQ